MLERRCKNATVSIRCDITRGIDAARGVPVRAANRLAISAHAVSCPCSRLALDSRTAVPTGHEEVIAARSARRSVARERRVRPPVTVRVGRASGV